MIKQSQRSRSRTRTTAPDRGEALPQLPRAVHNVGVGKRMILEVSAMEEILQHLRGPIVPVNVCFNADGSVDFSSVTCYVDWLCARRVPVVLLTYGSSEFMSLTNEEIWRLTAEVAQVVSGRSVFIASTAWWKPLQCREFLKHAETVGADAVKVQIHPWMPKEREPILGYFDRLEGASRVPLLAWGHTPPPLPIEIVVELAGRPYIIGMKNDGDPFYDYYDLIRSTRDQGFAVISGGQMRNFVFGHQLGSPAYLCTIAPFRPDIATEFHALLESGSYPEAWDIVFRYEEPWLKVATEVGWMTAIKSALKAYGLYPNNRPAPPLPEVTDESYGKVCTALGAIFGPIESAGLRA